MNIRVEDFWIDDNRWSGGIAKIECPDLGCKWYVYAHGETPGELLEAIREHIAHGHGENGRDGAMAKMFSREPTIRINNGEPVRGELNISMGQEYVLGFLTWSALVDVDMASAIGDRVVVTVDGGEAKYFGVGIVTNVVANSLVTTTCIEGCGPLGRREAVECTCDLHEVTTPEQAIRGEFEYMRGLANGCLIHGTDEQRTRIAALAAADKDSEARREAAMKAAREAP